MKTLAQCTLGTGAAAALLVGCGGSQPPIAAPFSSAATRLTAERTRTSVTYTVLYSFSGSTDGAFPNGGLLNVDDTLYGTTSGGGRHRCIRHRARLFCGTVFAITTSGAETQLYRFRGKRKDGASPNGGLIDVDGAFYGTTNGGGVYGYGTVYSITPSGAETVLHSFARSGDGSKPVAGLVSMQGTLYGTTPNGGKYGDGTVYSITPSGLETVLHSFGGQSGDGASPLAALVSVNGILYGTTPNGGVHGDGTVYSITPSGTEHVLHDFGGAGDGKYPSEGRLYVKGKLYGLTTDGGTGSCHQGCGTVFALTTSGKETVLYSFRRSKNSAWFPYGTLTNVDGTLYGMASASCDSCSGSAVFAIARSGSEKVIYRFDNLIDGQFPNGQLADVNGTLYGTTANGGAGESCSCGTVFALTP